MIMEYIDCPICNFKSYSIVYKGLTSVNDNISSRESYHPTASKGPLKNQVVRCTDCGFIYTNPREKEHTVIENYTTYVDPFYLTEEEGRRRNSQGILRYIREFKPSGRLLDVGCSAGFFLDEARKMGLEVYGQEPSEWAADFARKRLGLEVKVGFAEQIDYPNQWFDIVSLVGVLAHVRHPMKVLQEINRVLKKDGILFINTPDFECLMSKIFRSKWKSVKWQMLYFFSLKTLIEALERNGFVFISVRKRRLGKKYSLNFILSHLLSNKNLIFRLQYTLKKLRIDKLKLYLNLYEYLNIIAQKR